MATSIGQADLGTFFSMKLNVLFCLSFDSLATKLTSVSRRLQSWEGTSEMFPSNKFPRMERIEPNFRIKSLQLFNTDKSICSAFTLGCRLGCRPGPLKSRLGLVAWSFRRNGVVAVIMLVGITADRLTIELVWIIVII